MKWQVLSLTQKIMFGAAIILIALIAPEVTLLLQIGGIETTFMFVLLWLTPLLAKVRVILNCAKFWSEHLSTVINALWRSLPYRALSRPEVFGTQSLCCFVAWGLTGSLGWAVLCYVPGLLIIQSLL